MNEGRTVRIDRNVREDNWRCCRTEGIMGIIDEAAQLEHRAGGEDDKVIAASGDAVGDHKMIGVS